MGFIYNCTYVNGCIPIAEHGMQRTLPHALHTAQQPGTAPSHRAPSPRPPCPPPTESHPGLAALQARAAARTVRPPGQCRCALPPSLPHRWQQKWGRDPKPPPLVRGAAGRQLRGSHTGRGASMSGGYGRVALSGEGARGYTQGQLAVRSAAPSPRRPSPRSKKKGRPSRPR